MTAKVFFLLISIIGIVLVARLRFSPSNIIERLHVQKLLIQFLSILSFLPLAGNLYLLWNPASQSVPRTVNLIVYTLVSLYGLRIMLQISNIKDVKISNLLPLLILLQTIGLIIDDSSLISTVAFMNPFLVLPIIFLHRNFEYRFIFFHVARNSLAIWLSYLVLGVMIQPEKFLIGCRLDKCGVLGFRLSESFQGNVIGFVFSIFLGILISFVGFIIWIRIWIILSLLGLMIGGRASIFSLLIVLLIYLLLRQNIDRIQKQIIILKLIALATFITNLLFPFVLSKNTLFQDRAVLWKLSLEEISKSPLIGFGPNYWTSETNQAGIFTYSPHNLFLAIVVSGGFIGFVVSVYFFMKPVMSKNNEISLIILTMLILIFVDGFVESNINTVGVGTTQFLLTLYLFGLTNYENKKNESEL